MSVDLSQPRALHLVGIGGVGMGPLAALLTEAGHRITGSDIRQPPVVAELRRLGVAVAVGNRAEHLGPVDAVVIPSVVPGDNPEVLEARRRGIPVLSRADALAALARVRPTIAVSGTHGKTTTTAMLATILAASGADPSFLVGGPMLDASLATGVGSAHWGTGEWVVVEADESDGTFLFGAHVAVVTSIGADHLDYFGSIEGTEAAFARFVQDAAGPNVVCVDDERSARIAAGTDALTYGTHPGARFTLTDVHTDHSAVTFALHDGAGVLGEVTVPAPGRHNARNAAGAVVSALALGVDFDVASAAVASFAGVARRWQVRGSARGVTVVDDYAHNPGKLTAVIQAAAEGGWRRVVVAFQPQRYSRTRSLAADFGEALAGPDLVVITDVFPGGETPEPGVTGKLLVDATLDAHPRQRVAWLPDRQTLVPFLVGELRSGDLCLTLGAGDITTLVDDLLPALERRRR